VQRVITSVPAPVVPVSCQPAPPGLASSASALLESPGAG